MNTLQIYPQYAHHSEVYIAGSASALKDLRNAIDAALENDSAKGSSEHFASDGEGYTVHVHLYPEETMAILSTSYTADYAEDYRKTYPWTISE